MDGSNLQPDRRWRPSIEAVGGVLLAVASIAALVLASSPWAQWYASICTWPIVIAVDSQVVELTPTLIVNEGAMTLFFLTVGLEIRRELHAGELADPRRAALPVAAALGGMIAPALIYAAFNPGGEAARGWGVPMATDIAFALGALALLGRHASPAVRVLLLSLAIVDDVGSVLVIAVVYSDAIVPRWLPLILIGVVLTLAMRRNGVRSPLLFVLPGATLWFGLLHSGVHPTLAGVVMGLLTPPSECERLQSRLHPWVTLAIVPAFAFLNAGVALEWPVAEPQVAMGVALGLLVGKPVGIIATCSIAIRLRLVGSSSSLGWREITVVGLLAGVGFTVALFVAEIAFAEAGMLSSAKAGIVAASSLAMVLAAIAGRFLLRTAPR
ncbi:MAG TPA: Na+/H+ antiporter NhaA [Nannocystaceae bacterium]|nr:Na+/H+ antiporter NhaA [Nannocystaceae bacterium]